MNTIRCPHCGITNRAGSNFCNRCGTDLRAGEADATTDTTLAAPSEIADAAYDPTLATPAQNSPPTNPPALAAESSRELLPDLSALTDESFMDVDEFAPEAIEGEVAEPLPLAMTGRLITGVQGLLEPLRISSELDEASASSAPSRPFTAAIDLKIEQLRHLRGLMTQDPTLLNAPALPSRRYAPALRRPWIFILLGLLVGIPIFLLFGRPVGEVHQWPGVADAHTQIQNLAPNAPVLILWAYDPATADEMDLVALPLVTHLFDRQSLPIVVSLLPNGPATARRLFARATLDLLASQPRSAQTEPPSFGEGGFLPGGATVLALLAQNLSAGINGQPTPALMQRPALIVVVAATGEAVQQWLELAQPVDKIPVVAFTSAGADPILRPYLDSGQLSGLVSGFDGAYAYQQLRTRPLSQAEATVYRRQLIFQNWGHLAFFLVIVLGNLAALIFTRS